MGTEVIGDIITELDTSKRPFTAKGDSGTTYTADAVILADLGLIAHAAEREVDAHCRESGFPEYPHGCHLCVKLVWNANSEDGLEPKARVSDNFKDIDCISPDAPTRCNRATFFGET